MPSGPRRLLPASTTSLPRPPGESDVTGDNAFISVSCFPTVKTKTKDPPKLQNLQRHTKLLSLLNRALHRLEKAMGTETEIQTVNAAGRLARARASS